VRKKTRRSNVPRREKKKKNTRKGRRQGCRTSVEARRMTLQRLSPKIGTTVQGYDEELEACQRNDISHPGEQLHEDVS
jgi:hypothetical protein